MNLKGDKTYIILGLTLLVLGSIGLFLPAISGFFISDLPLQEVAMAQMPTFEDQFIASDEDATVTPVPTPPPSAPSGGGGLTSDYDRFDVKDRLIISKAKINMPVFLGASEKVLNKGGWLFPTTSRPELGGNSVVFGHRYKYLPPISNTMYNLDKVEIGDELILVWHGKEYKYKVFETKIVEPADLSVIQPTSDNRLTIITCTPLYTTKQRLVVVGSLIQAN